MTDNPGPGIGTLIGLRMAQVRNDAEAQASDLDSLRGRLRSAQSKTFYDQAFTLATADVIAVVLAELAGDRPRVLSIPSAVDARNAKYVQLAAEHVKALSNGRVQLTVTDQKRIAADRPLR